MKMKKILSYILPITKKIPSNYSGILEVTLVNGKKVLDSKNANYSFGSLKKILERGLYEIDLEGVSSVLVLGMGGGSIIHSLRDTFAYTGRIDAVEIDPVVIDIAKKEFGIQESEHTRIFNADALEYVKQCPSQVDIIVIDILDLL